MLNNIYKRQIIVFFMIIYVKIVTATENILNSTKNWWNATSRNYNI